MNKGELRAHMKALLNRSDCTDALADTFIDQAIGRIQRTLRIPIMEKQREYAISNAAGAPSVTLPSDMLELIDIYIGGVALVRIPMHEMQEAHQTGQVGTPRYFCRQQGAILLHPKPSSGTLHISYYGEFDALVNDSDSTPLTVLASDAISYTALGYASDFFLDERGQLFDGKAALFLAEIQEQADTAEQSGGTQVMRPTHLYGND